MKGESAERFKRTLKERVMEANLKLKWIEAMKKEYGNEWSVKKALSRKYIFVHQIY